VKEQKALKQGLKIAEIAIFSLLEKFHSIFFCVDEAKTSR